MPDNCESNGTGFDRGGDGRPCPRPIGGARACVQPAPASNKTLTQKSTAYVAQTRLPSSPPLMALPPAGGDGRRHQRLSQATAGPCNDCRGPRARARVHGPPPPAPAALAPAGVTPAVDGLAPAGVNGRRYSRPSRTRPPGLAGAFAGLPQGSMTVTTRGRDGRARLGPAGACHVQRPQASMAVATSAHSALKCSQ